MNNVLGIDIGSRGAIAIVNDETGELVEVHDMPTLDNGPKGRLAVNPALLADIIYKSHARHAFVELVGPRPGEGAVQGFTFGRSRGVVEGVLGAVGVPVTMLTPATWKRAVSIAPGTDRKDDARAEAVRRWPTRAVLFARKRDDGRAEAGLIAVAGLVKERS